MSVNHPKPLGPEWSYGDLRGNHAIEIWNGPWGGLNNQAWPIGRTRLRRGERSVAMGGSDTHNLKSPRARLFHPRLGTPTTWVKVHGEPSADARSSTAIRRGRCFVSASPAGPQLVIERRTAMGCGSARPGRRLNPGHPLRPGRRSRFRGAIRRLGNRPSPYPPGARYLRAQILDSAGTMPGHQQPHLARLTPLDLDSLESRSERMGACRC